MNIKDWPTNKIMQLPDCCFGRRFEIALQCRSSAAGAQYIISTIALPDRCVIWELQYNTHMLVAAMAPTFGLVSFALGDQQPATGVMFNRLEQLFTGAEWFENYRYVFRLPFHLVRMRKAVEAQGKRLVMSYEQTSSASLDIMAVFVVSSFPTEVPEWLISGKGNYR